MGADLCRNHASCRSEACSRTLHRGAAERPRRLLREQASLLQEARRLQGLRVSKDMTMSQERRYSFEFFPTKTDAGHEKLIATARQLATYNPDFFSCTYGAGGSTRDRTLNTVLQLESEVKVPAAPHLSCVGDSKNDLRGLLTQYKAAGIQRIVALRGDLPSGMGMASGELRHANDLVEFIREETGDHFHIEIAAYPEMHPQARNFEDDLNNFVRKANAGADSAITQYFFNADCYFYFVERVRA